MKSNQATQRRLVTTAIDLVCEDDYGSHAMKRIRFAIEVFESRNLNVAPSFV
jgi:hypothetical protein